jgi:hypothetical protein
MDRIIKFRVWNGSKMLDPHDTPVTTLSYISSPKHGFNSPYGYKVMQFTELVDKSGREIFEGDIRRFKTGIGIIIWSDAAFAVKSPGSEAIDWEHSTILIDREYLGNIYENPELINP